MSSNYPKSFDLKQKKLITAFNVSDFRNNNQNITAEDLSDYANLFEVNVFSASVNYFRGILVSSINSVSSNTLEFLKDISQNVQEALTDIFNNLTILNGKTQNMDFDLSTETTFFNKFNVFENLSINKNVAIAGKVGISNELKCSSIRAIDLTTKNIKCSNSLYSNEIYINNRKIINIGCWIYLNGICFPVEKEFILNDLPSSLVYFSLFPDYQIYIYLNNDVIYYHDNNTTNPIYYKNSQISNFDKIIIKYKYIDIN